MKNYRNLCLALLAGTFLSVPVRAEILEPTLDMLKTEAVNISGNYVLTELTGQLPAGMSEVEINNVKYYFDPSGEDTLLLTTLAGTSAGKLVESAEGIFELNGKHYSFDVSAIPSSAFSYAEGSEGDYTFTVQEADAEGNLTTQYYKVVMKPETFSTSENISWGTSGVSTGDVSGSVEVVLPNTEPQAFYYQYTKSSGYEDVTVAPKDFSLTNPSEEYVYQSGGAAINHTSGDYGDISSKLFVDNQTNVSFNVTGSVRKSLHYYGGVISNFAAGSETSTLGDIRADFVDNSLTLTVSGENGYGSVHGGVISNVADENSNAVIGNITGDFIGNSVSVQGDNVYTYGGVIYNGGIYQGNSSSTSAIIGNITGDFIGNSGGAIYNDGGDGFTYAAIGNITGDFIGNSDGAIENHYGTIGNITGDFIGNSGGAIDNRDGTISNITGDFIGNSGLLIDNWGTISNITGDFIGNSGGAIENHYGTISNVTGNFIGNGGWAIENSGTIGDITGDFIGNSEGAIVNHMSTGNITGNFIGNGGSGIVFYPGSYSGDITGDFISNSGGGINVQETIINDITGDFIGNYIESDRGVQGGGISLSVGTINNISGNFIKNYAQSNSGDASGGAIYNYVEYFDSTTIGDISGDFIGNYAESNNESAYGGAIYNRSSDYSGNAGIGKIIGDFVGNYASGREGAYGGAILNGAIYNEEDVSFTTTTIGDIVGDFTGNYALGGNKAFGGAIYNYAQGDSEAAINSITGNFLNNYAESTETSSLALGGSVYTNRSLTFTSGNDERFISGNYTSDLTRGKSYNAIFVEGSTTADSAPTITFDTTGGGAWIINDNIEGGSSSPEVTYTGQYYNLSFNGDDVLNERGRTTQYISINNDIINADNISVENTTLHFGAYNHGDDQANNSDGYGRILAGGNDDGRPVTKMTLTNAAFDVYNGYHDTVNLAGWKSADSFLHIDVDTDNLIADILNVQGDISGVTNVIVYASSTADITGKSILFATSTGSGAEDSFSVYRVYNSPYLFDVEYNPDGDEGKEWSLSMNNEKENEYKGILPDYISDPKVPDPDNPDIDIPDIDIPDIDIPDIDVPSVPDKVYAEVAAYGVLPMAALEQTRNMIDNVGNQVKNNRIYTRSCSFVDDYWNGDMYQTLWVNPTYHKSHVDSAFEFDADIWGIEAGGSFQYDINNRLGIFVSYRNGDYDVSGKGDRYYSATGSEIDIDSYIAGLYYRYDRNNWYAFATVYGGTQEADIKTDDGLKTDADGIEFGASLEGGYDYALNDSLTVTPEFGVFYTQVNYDDIKDTMGKTAKYENVRQVELEAGIKLSKLFAMDEGSAKIYIKPSVVQTIVDGGEVRITGLNELDTQDDMTLGRIEIGGSYGLMTNLSAYGWANYTFGSDYDATTFGVGLNYAF